MPQNEVRWVAQHVGACQRQTAGELGEHPVEADHHAHPDAADRVDGRRRVARIEPAFLLLEKVQLAVDAADAARTQQQRRVEHTVAGALREAGHQVQAARAAEGNQGLDDR